MATKKARLNATAQKIGAILEEHLGTLPAADAKAMLKDIHKLAIKSSRRANRGRV